ncbi:hypothetical protein SAMN04488034_10388 [Salinimicrobium catena]|uniref:ABM domain-containing protein n=1 Tax=Salinimicrobium catena TaxID=390640 RepID=A0A1H5MT52_9FLAO|nr:hypothetical protein [Salinimicrobium catena]SDL29049.1 hypothetical protein SAMN04488140_10388 [Salinimicrobium catena]SEE92433.1 hypothetical protein SAMN04488034_10388 [Salinimicrobium catena]
MKKFAYSFPILEDKVDQWLNFVKEVNTTRKDEFTEMHKRIGVKKESWFLQNSNEEYSVLVYTEAESDEFMDNFKKDKSNFSDWFRKEVSELQNIDLDYKTEMPIKVLDWEE